MSVVAVQTCSIPREQVLESVHTLQGADPVGALNVVPATQGARLGGSAQQSGSTQIIPVHGVDASFAFMSMGHWWVAHCGRGAQQSAAEHVDDEHRKRALLATVDVGQENEPHVGSTGVTGAWPGTTGLVEAEVALGGATSTTAGMLVTVRTFSKVNMTSPVPSFFPILLGGKRYLRGTGRRTGVLC